MNDAATDDLSRPLGAVRPRKGSRPAMPAQRIFAMLSGMMLAVLAGQIYLGRRAAEQDAPVAEIRRRAETAAPQATVRVDPAIDRPSDRPTMSAQDMESASGVTVVRGGGFGAPESVVIQVPAPNRPRLAAPDKRLLERSRHGALPRIAADGTRPAAFYARPAAAANGRPRIAILVGGLGISQTATAEAMAKLPEAVSLAFAPYGADLDRQAQKARSDGHEIFLQAPMEPFDYPDNDPGPHTLRVGAPDSENIDRLHWVMSRIQGYVGVVNYMGAKFTAQDQSLRPVAREIAERGLMLVDDGSSNRSLISSAGAALKAPAARADMVIDAVMRADVIDRELARLEAIAREKGSAFGVATAMPLSIERISRWARALEAKGVVLTPVSALAPRAAGDPSQ